MCDVRPSSLSSRFEHNKRTLLPVAIAAPETAVSVAAIVEALSAGGSTWGRADVLRVLCNSRRPQQAMTGEAWADQLEAICAEVVASCIELDPTVASAPRRESDGRSLWLEPISTHLTSERVLNEETRILAWAIDAQTLDPQPSTTVDRTRLDILQADAAAAVAGHDRLVLAVGPAGAGKTTTLAAAATDLHRHGRVVFGVAPSTKAARTLERETGMRADTLAKLLYEWERPDRPPADPYRLPAGATIVVDEAGMIGTGALDRLIRLTEQRRWRLVLVGDPYQLQAVGGGGMFHELCTTGRIRHLAHIHRFHQPWEAASLQLRHGDPAAVETYISHGRVDPGEFDEHLDHIAHLWLRSDEHGRTIAVTAATNQHVDAINDTVQTARAAAGQLDTTVSASIGHGQAAHPGDVIVTRRNNRQIHTTTGEPIRNRELWTITTIHDGALHVTSRHGTGHAVLPADYVTEHVHPRLRRHRTRQPIRHRAARSRPGSTSSNDRSATTWLPPGPTPRPTGNGSLTSSTTSPTPTAYSRPPNFGSPPTDPASTPPTGTSTPPATDNSTPTAASATADASAHALPDATSLPPITPTSRPSPGDAKHTGLARPPRTPATRRTLASEGLSGTRCNWFLV